MCYPAILTKSLIPQPGLSSILQNQLGVALDALTAPRLVSFPTSVPDNDDEDDGRTSPPHRSYLIYALVHRTGWYTDNVGRRN